MKPIKPRLFLDRFLKYVTFDTQSVEESETYPSTAKQLELSHYLVSELKNMGLHDVEMTEHGYVFATLLSNVRIHVPTIGFIAHIDTSPDVSGANVRPVINKKYKGGDIVLKKDKRQIIKESFSIFIL